MNTIEKQLLTAPKNYRYIFAILLILMILFAWSLSTVQLSNIESSGLTIAQSIMTGILQPDLELLFNFTNQGVLYLLIETMAIAFLGTIIGSILAIPLAFLSANNIVPKPIAYITKLLLICIRTVPAIVYGLMLIRVTGQGPFTGVLTMAFVSIGMLSKLFTDVIEDLDTKVLESMASIGCNLFEKIRFGIIPQLSSAFLSTMIYRFDMNMRDASVLGLVGAGGIGAPLIFAMNAYRWNEVGALLIGLVILILIIEYCSNKIRTKLVNG